MKQSTFRNLLDFAIITLLAIGIAFIALENSHGATPPAKMIIVKPSKIDGKVKEIRDAGAKMLVVKKK